MRILVWTCRVILTVVVLAFAATVFYMTHDVDDHFDSAMPALNLVTVIGASLVGLTWPITRRYWHSLALLIALVGVRILYGGESPSLSTLDTELLTPWQSNYIWIAIGVTGLSLIVTITWRAVAGDKAVRAIREAAAGTTAAQTVTAVQPAQVVMPAATVEPPAPAVVEEADKEDDSEADQKSG